MLGCASCTPLLEVHMKYYFAPLEGLTDSIYRKLHTAYFGGPDRYYTPFFSPTVHRALTAKEQRELPFADTLGYTAIPQVLTKNSEDFIWFAGQCADRGYQELNLNIGCPSGTVTAKGKGSGMLRDPEALDRFLEEIFSAAPLPISVKTRIGFYSSEEFPQILEILNRYPICELTVHPRIRGDFYKGTPDMDAFHYAIAHSKAPICYNGDIVQIKQIDSLPPLNSIMIGRGLIADPGMLNPQKNTTDNLRAFCNDLLTCYTENFGSAKNAMFRLKEHWFYLLTRFEGAEKLGKQLRKTTDFATFQSITQQIFDTCPRI